MSVHGDEPVDETTRVFTQAEVFMVGGYLAETWADGVPADATDDTEQAIQAVLSSARVISPSCEPGCVCGDVTLCGTVDPDLLSVCPKCGGLVEDLDGFGVLIHDACGYCSHPDSYAGKCRHCGAPDA